MKPLFVATEAAEAARANTAVRKGRLPSAPHMRSPHPCRAARGALRAVEDFGSDPSRVPARIYIYLRASVTTLPEGVVRG